MARRLAASRGGARYPGASDAGTRNASSKQLAEIDKVLAQECLDDPRALKLMTIPGVSSVVASIVLASIGDITRFPSPDKLSSYFGLTPRIRQSGDHPARHGRISKQGYGDVRKMLVEAAWSAKTAPGPLRAFFNRIQKKRGGGAAAGRYGT